MTHLSALRTHLFRLCFLMAITPLVPVSAQEQGSAATFTTETNLVQVPVIVTERSGQHLSGLQQGDFTIRDEGQVMKIVSFEEIKTIPSRVTKPGQPGVYTNTLDTAPRGMTIIILDQVNTPFLDQATARRQLLKFLADHVGLNEPVALILLGRRGVRVVHDFTTDPAILVAALKRVSGRSDNLALTGENTQVSLGPGDIMTYEVNALDQFYNGTDGRYGVFAITQAIEITLSALMHVAQTFEGVPGRKSVIWATGGFPFTLTTSGELASLRYYTTGATRADYGGATAGGALPDGSLPPLPESNSTTSDDLFAAVRPQFQRTMVALNRANIAIYPIDARGLVAYSSAATSRVRINDVYGTEAQTHSTMNDIAAVTGGKAYYNSNDIAGAFADAANESRQYYLLSYYAAKEKKPGWHKLKVNVNRPNTEVRARVGYMSGVAAKKPEVLKNMEIRAALASPLDYTALPLQVRWTGQPSTAEAGKKKVPFEVIVSGKETTIDKSNKNRIDLQFVVVARDPQGGAAAQLGQQVETNLPEAAVPQAVSEGLNYAQALNLAPGTYQVVFVVRDNLSGRVGSVNVPLSVP